MKWWWSNTKMKEKDGERSKISPAWKRSEKEKKLLVYSLGLLIILPQEERKAVGGNIILLLTLILHFFFSISMSLFFEKMHQLTMTSNRKLFDHVLDSFSFPLSLALIQLLLIRSHGTKEKERDCGHQKEDEIVILTTRSYYSFMLDHNLLTENGRERERVMT